MKPEPPCKTEQMDNTRLCFSLKIKCTWKRVLKASVYVTPLRVKEATGPFWCHKVWETLGPQGRRQDGTYFPSPHACIDCSQSTRPGGPRTEHKEGEGEFAAERKDLKWSKRMVSECRRKFFTVQRRDQSHNRAVWKRMSEAGLGATFLRNRNHLSANEMCTSILQHTHTNALFYFC